MEQQNDPIIKIVDEKNSKKIPTALQPPISRESTRIRSANSRENRTRKHFSNREILQHICLAVPPNTPLSVKETKKSSGTTRVGLTEDLGIVTDEQGTLEAPKMIILATMSQFHPTRLCSYGETADRSERLRRYNLNETFSTSVVLTSIRDIPLKPPVSLPSSEPIPAWKLIRPRKPKVMPHAEPICEYSFV